MTSRPIIALMAILLLTNCKEGTKKVRIESPEEAHSPESCVRLFYKLISNGDCETVMDMVDKAMTETVMAMRETGCPQLGQDLRKVDCNEENGFATCECKVNNGQGTHEVFYRLEKEEDRWIITKRYTLIPWDARQD